MAKTYEELPVEKWNTRHFTEYMKALHREVLGVDYQPGGGWQREAGLLGTLIGTQKKPAQYDKAVIKEFIERNIRAHSPSRTYPGTNFMFMWTYKKHVLQQIQVEHMRAKEAEENAAAQKNEVDDLTNWL